MQVWCDWQLTLCDPHLSALEMRFHDDALYKSMFTFQLKMHHKAFDGQAPPEAAGGAHSTPLTHSCI